MGKTITVFVSTNADSGTATLSLGGSHATKELDDGSITFSITCNEWVFLNGRVSIDSDKGSDSKDFTLHCTKDNIGISR